MIIRFILEIIFRKKKKKKIEKNEIEFLVNEIKKLCPMTVNGLRNKDKTMS